MVRAGGCHMVDSPSKEGSSVFLEPSAMEALREYLSNSSVRIIEPGFSIPCGLGSKKGRKGMAVNPSN